MPLSRFEDKPSSYRKGSSGCGQYERPFNDSVFSDDRPGPIETIIELHHDLVGLDRFVARGILIEASRSRLANRCDRAEPEICALIPV
jgi:hypothetical protein